MSTVDTTAATRRAADLRPGDVVRIDGGSNLHSYAEVRCVERNTAGWWVILFAGGLVQTVPVHESYFMVDAATAEQWRADQETARQIGELGAFFDMLADGMAAGVPLPRYGSISINWWMAGRVDLERAAAALGVPAEITERGRYVRLTVERGRHTVEFMCDAEPESAEVAPDVA